MTESSDIFKQAEEWLAEFHQLWLDNGKPHPNSNAYLNMNRDFWFRKGYQAGIQEALKHVDD